MLDAVDAYGVPEMPEDRDTPAGGRPTRRAGSTATKQPLRRGDGEPLAVRPARRPDPVNRHNWLVGQAVRLACAHRLGRIIEDDHAKAVALLAERFGGLLASHGEPRRPTPGEVAGALAWGVRRAASLTDQQAADDLGVNLGPIGVDLDDQGSSAAAGDECHGAGPGGLFVDIAAVLNGDDTPRAMPTLLTRTDGRCLFYDGKHNGLFGDPETGKTWVALAAGAERLRNGGRFVFIDMDHNGVHDTLKRLRMLGVPPEVLADPNRFLYVEPDDADHLCDAVTVLRGWVKPPTMTLLDSAGELLPLMGADSNNNDQVTNAFRATAIPLAKAGAAVATIDHLAKNAESRRRGPVGAYGKTRIYDGSMTRVFQVEPFVPGQGGAASLWIHKDRSGAVRRRPSLRGATTAMTAAMTTAATATTPTKSGGTTCGGGACSG